MMRMFIPVRPNRPAPIVTKRRWPRAACVICVALCSLWVQQAMALSLGRVMVQSALGEPLRADIDFLELSPEEASTLSTTIASPEAFRAAGLAYLPAVSGLQASLQKRADGRLFVRLSSSGPMTEAFFDLLLEANWASGRLLRDYTLLLAPAKAAVTRANDASSDRARTVKDGKLTVKAGDTASHIAAATKPANVSLDQMLVALLRANPGVFQGDNVNRIQAGAVLAIPTVAQAAETPRPEATRIIAAQSQDFNDFRRKFAGVAPEARPEAASRQASGKVQARVDDKQAPAAGADKLTLAKSSVQDALSEEQLAKQRSTREAAARADEIARNISELNKLGASTQAAAASAPASAARPESSAPVAPVAIPNPLPASAPASAAQAPASALAPAKSTDRIDRLVDHPLVPWGAGALMTTLASVIAYRIGRRRRDGLPPEDVLPDQTLDGFVASNSAPDTSALNDSDPQETQFAPSRNEAPEPIEAEPEPLPAAEPANIEAEPELEIDFPLDEPAGESVPLPEPLPDELDLEFDTPEREPEPPSATPPEPLPLDLGSLSLDLGEEFQDSKAQLKDLADDPMETKLALAEEFRAIGDEDGARSLIEEVIEAATGDMKARAERALGKLK